MNFTKTNITLRCALVPDSTTGEITATGGADLKPGTVVTPNILASNAIIHEIDYVLFTHTVWTLIKSSAPFTEIRHQIELVRERERESQWRRWMEWNGWDALWVL